MIEIKAVVADDEIPARSELKYILQTLPGVRVIHECANGQEVLDFLKENPQVDILFMDIEMPVMNGIETAQHINELGLDVKIVFSTGFDQFAIKAFELEVFDYILKPYKEERVTDTIRRLRSGKEQDQDKKTSGEIVFPHKKFAVYSDKKIVLLNPSEEIVLVKTEKFNYTLFYTTRGILESKILLKDVESELSHLGFCRTHKSYVVNLNMIKEILPWFNETFLLVPFHFEKEEIPVSRHYLKNFKQLMQMK